MFKRKNKHVHQLTVGLRTQLCKECHDLQTRLCEVDGRPALFHRWVDEDKVLFKFDCFVTEEDYRKIFSIFQEKGVIPKGCSAEKVRSTFALVEYRDGSVGKVDPALLTFLDKGAIQI
jgi:hypothetical protein